MSEIGQNLMPSVVCESEVNKTNMNVKKKQIFFTASVCVCVRVEGAHNKYFLSSGVMGVELQATDQSETG